MNLLPRVDWISATWILTLPIEDFLKNVISLLTNSFENFVLSIFYFAHLSVLLNKCVCIWYLAFVHCNNGWLLILLAFSHDIYRFPMRNSQLYCLAIMVHTRYTPYFSSSCAFAQNLNCDDAKLLSLDTSGRLSHP